MPRGRIIPRLTRRSLQEDEAMQYIIDNKGIGSEASYPYTAKDGKCHAVPSVASIKVRKRAGSQTNARPQWCACV